MTPAGSRWQELAWLLASPLPSLHFPDSRCGCLELISTFSADVSSWMSHRHPVQHDPPLPGGTLFYSSKSVSLSASLNFPAQVEAPHLWSWSETFDGFFVFLLHIPSNRPVRVHYQRFPLCLSRLSVHTAMNNRGSHFVSSPVLCPHTLFFYSSARNISKGQIIFHLFIQLISAT